MKMLDAAIIKHFNWVISHSSCYGRHSPNQSLVAYTGSATGSDHSLDAPVVFEASSSVHSDHVVQSKGPEVRNQVVPGLFFDASGALRGANQGVWRACMPPTLLCKVLLSYICS
eukprot:6197236-Pleurochrysis_carterae.AAC.1